MTRSDELKRAVGYEAAALIEEGMTVGLGTGSTVRYLLEAIAERRGRGELAMIVGVPTSEATRKKAEELGIPLTDLAGAPEVGLTLDGADEVDPALDVIKGLGGALLREKVVATASRRLVIMVDSSKRVERLGEKAPLPVEVDPFGLPIQLPFLRDLGCEPRVREGADGSLFRTDGGHLIVDCYFPKAIPDPIALAAALDRRTGIFEHGLFLGMAESVLIGGDEGVEVLTRTERSV